MWIILPLIFSVSVEHIAVVCDRYGISSLDGGDGSNMIINDGNMLGWGPTALLSPTDPLNKIPALSPNSTCTDIPSYPLVGTVRMIHQCDFHCLVKV
jgi:hypothetical protein